MAETLAKAVLELSVSNQKEMMAALEELKKQGKDLESQMEKTGKSVKDAGNFFVFDLAGVAKTALGAVKTALVEVVKGAIELGQQGAAVADVSESFGGLSQRVGETSSAMLGALREGTKSTLSDFELMKMSNGALSNGFIKSAQDARTLATGAMGLADRMGTDVKTAFDTLTSAMATGRTGQLKQLGLFVDTDAAAASYAQTIGKSVKDLTDQEKAQGMVRATLAALHTEFKDPAPLDFGDRIDQAKAGLENFRNDLGLAIATSPALATGMQVLGDEIARAFGTDRQDRVKTLTSLVNSLAIGIMDGASIAVEGARYISVAWDGLKVVFSTIAAGLTSALAAVSSGIALVVETAAKVPGIGPGFAEIAVRVREATNALYAERDSFAQQAVAAYDGATQTNAAMDSVQASIGRVRAAMVAATQAQVENTTATKTHLPIAQAAADANEKRSKAAEVAAQREAAAYEKAEDEIRAKTLSVQQELALAQTTGLERKLMELDIAQANELARLPPLRLGYETEYGLLTTMIETKYAQMKLAAADHATNVVELAKAQGFQTRAEMETTAATQLALYEQMKASGQFTSETLAAQWEKYETARRASMGQTKDAHKDMGQSMLSSAADLLGTLGKKNKTAAIAGAIISTYLAISKSLASLPFPANLVAAAGAAAVGWQNVAKIKSSEPGGYKEGTPNLDFARFGQVSIQALHNDEAVIPRGKGHMLAGEIAQAMPGDDRMAATLDRIEAALSALPQTIKRAFRDANLATT